MSNHTSRAYGDTGLLLSDLVVDDGLALLLVARAEDPNRCYCAWAQALPTDQAWVNQLLRSEATIEYHRRLTVLFGQPYEAFEADARSMVHAQRTAQDTLVARCGGMDEFVPALFETSLEQLNAWAEEGLRFGRHLQVSRVGVIAANN